ncbi:hypothetical protein E2C01_060341 [Portunus trituberculatus]|uniref:Uncharacterized protein n=1 Tax=Portunus trituberculatus TaxID=210409 RepID=A0A5B7H969_PORTR|nr:hypothetical protein [Portunus trituberculatus]
MSIKRGKTKLHIIVCTAPAVSTTVSTTTATTTTIISVITTTGSTITATTTDTIRNTITATTATKPTKAAQPLLTLSWTDAVGQVTPRARPPADTSRPGVVLRGGLRETRVPLIQSQRSGYSRGGVPLSCCCCLLSTTAAESLYHGGAGAAFSSTAAEAFFYISVM